MLNYPWPGNIRELKNTLERIVLLEDSDTLKAEFLPFSKVRAEESSFGKKIDRILAEPIREDGIDFDGIIADLEQRLIDKASMQSNGNQSKTARLLNMKRDKLRYRLKSLETESEQEVEPS
jgi:two-component system response regulator AtoC